MEYLGNSKSGILEHYYQDETIVSINATNPAERDYREGYESVEDAIDYLSEEMEGFVQNPEL